MNDISLIITFLQKYSLEILIIGLLTVTLTNFTKKLLPDSLKNFKGYLPFLFGVILYALYTLIFLGEINAYTIISKGVQCGGLATLLYAFFKHILASKGGIKSSVSELLKGIISSKSIKEVVTHICNLFSTQINDDEMLVKIEEILRENTDVKEEVLTAVAKIIKNTITDKK